MNKKIAIISSGLGHVNRGIEIWANDLAYSLRDVGEDVTLFKGGGTPNSEIEKKIPCIRRDSVILGGVNSKLPWYYRYLIEQFTFSIMLLFQLRKGYDIAHLQDFYVANILKKAKEMGIIKSDIIFTNGTNQTLEFCNKFNHVQLLAPYYLKKAKNQGINTQKWFCIPNFVDTELFKPNKDGEFRKKLNIPENAIVILSVGVITKRYKRMDWVIREVSKLQKEADEDIYLLIVGGREDESAEVIDYGKNLLKNVIFLLNEPFKNMPPIYSIADVFVSGALDEIFGIVFLEAMASGVPAIGHDFPVTKWIIDDGGECIDMNKEGELSNTLKKYLNEEYKIKRGRNARKRVENMFSKKVVVRDILRMYNQIEV